MRYTIRTAVKADEDIIRELFQEMLRTIYDTEDVEGYGDGDLDRFFTGKEDRIYVAEDGKVTAFLSVEVHHEEHDYIYLDDFCVTKACRNKGIGTMLVNTAVSYAKEKKLSAVLLHVEKTNTGALRLYERMCFAVFRDDGHIYLMKKDIG